MNKILFLLTFIFTSFGVFGQSPTANPNEQLSDSLKLLKNTLKKHAIYSPSKRDRTVFWGKHFDTCDTEYTFISKLSSPSAAMVDFRPIASSTGTFNVTNSSSPITNDSRTGTVYRDPNVSRSNQISRPSYGRKRNDKFKQLDFKWVVEDSIILSTESEKNRYSISFSIQEINGEIKTIDKQTIYLKFKKAEDADTFLQNFKKVVTYCHAEQ